MRSGCLPIARVMAADRERLEDLILEGKLDELFSLVSLEDIADAWCRYTSRPHLDGVDEEDPDEWTLLFVTDIEDLDELCARTLLDLLVDRAPNDEVLEVVGAGPLEDFVKGYDEDRLLWIEQRAASSARFRQALACVWIWSLEPEVFARVERAAGVPLARPSEGVIIEIVPGDLPGTIHIKRNGLTVTEFETEPDHVEDMIKLLKQHSPIRRAF
jgi:hypothetical protein